MSPSQIVALSLEEREEYKVRLSLKGRTAVEIVQFWYTSPKPFHLTTAENKIRERWDFAKAHFLAGHTYTETMHALMAEFKIAVAQARNDIRNMRHAFGNLDEVPKNVHRQRAIEMALAAYRSASKHDDADGMSKATKAYIAAAGLEKDDDNRLDFEKLMRERTYVEALDPQVRSLLLNFLTQSGGVVDASKIFETVYASKGEEYIDYEASEPPAEDDENR